MPNHRINEAPTLHIRSLSPVSQISWLLLHLLRHQVVAKPASRTFSPLNKIQTVLYGMETSLGPLFSLELILASRLDLSLPGTSSKRNASFILLTSLKMPIYYILSALARRLNT
jgi:hypothetical protein